MDLFNNLLLILYFMSYTKAQFNECDKSKFNCKNGHCINLDQLCDGQSDCENNFDEQSSICAAVKCPKFTFKCLYGACIAKELECDGTIDCHDGSDEAATICSSAKVNSNCLKYESECKNHQCIPNEKLCDGKYDCTDNSDETVERCGRLRCPPFSFRCNYGACIPGTLKCDHKEDCVDGSDEENCMGIKIETTTSNILKTTTMLHIQQTTRIIQDEKLTISGCHIPTDSMLTLTDLYGNIFASETKAPIETFIKYSCPKGTYLKGQFNTNFCDGLNWINPHPQCIKLCAPIQGHTIHVSCTSNGKGVDCNRPVEPGTIAKISCAVMYEKPKTRKINEDLYCDNDGNWNYSPFKCEQICGTIDTKIPFSVMSDITDIHKVPWQVAIYSKSNDNAIYQFICGGTLIESKIVISAAHCFWNSKTSRLFDVSNYVISVGKFYQDYYATNETQPVQYSNISKIDIPLQFLGGDYDFISDIAVLTLYDHIEYRNHIRPACLTWRANNEKMVPSNKLGTIAGWGVTDTGKLSPDLRSVTLLSVDGETCIRKKITRNDRIANDKFCVETNDGQNVCRGDSGGGFIVSEDIGGASYYHLWGVVSSGITSKNFDGNECNSNFVTTFTNIQWYENLVKTAISNIYSTV